MTAVFSGEEILEICKGRLASGLMPDEVGAIVTDTRLLAEGQWYIAFSGQEFDGHDFLGDAFAAGALGAIVAERSNYPIGNQQFPLIAVEDTLEAYHALARNWRKRISPKVIGITGSSGKSIAKEMCLAVFCRKRRCHYSANNSSNKISVPETLLSMPDDTQVCVIEFPVPALGHIDQLANCAQPGFGQNDRLANCAQPGFGHTDRLASCALPDLGIITNVGSAHLEFLGSRENIVMDRSELLQRLNKVRGVAIVGSSEKDLLQRAKSLFAGRMHVFSEESIEIISKDLDASRFRIDGSEQIFEVKAHGMPLLSNAWCAVMSGREFGLNDAEIAEGLKCFEPLVGRGNRLQAINGALLIDNTYDTNLESIRAAVMALSDQNIFSQSKKYVVLGDLPELGSSAPAILEELGSWLKGKPLNLLVTVGGQARHIYAGASGAAFDLLHCQLRQIAEQELQQRLDADTCVLIMGVRKAGLDKLVAALIDVI